MQQLARHGSGKYSSVICIDGDGIAKREQATKLRMISIGLEVKSKKVRSGTDFNGRSIAAGLELQKLNKIVKLAYTT